LTVLFSVLEEVTTPADVQSESRMLRVSSIDSDRDSAESLKRHSSVISPVVLSNLPLSLSAVQNTAYRNSDTTHLHVNDTVSSVQRRLPRRATTRRVKLSRKSTRLIRQRIPERNISEFDDDNDADVDEREELTFSETDSGTSDNEHASGSCDDSDLEFETELARQLNISQVRCALPPPLMTSGIVVTDLCRFV